MKPVKTKDFLGRKKCPSCGEWKKFSFFQKNISRYDGLQSHCKECFKLRYRKYDPIKRRSRHLKKCYGLEYSDYLYLLKKQDCKCKICKIPIKAIGDKNIKTGAHIDHCHKNGRIRGLLCHGCNAALGYFSENIETIKEAIKYLEFFKNN